MVLAGKVGKVPTDKEVLRLTGKRDRLIGCVEKESILDKDISTCLPVSLNFLSTKIPTDWKGKGTPGGVTGILVLS